jgi:phosphoglycerate kinase
MEKFSKGTKEIGEFLTTLDAEVIAGGGDTIAAVQHFELTNKISHISTGGGASLEFIEKDGKLPALVALEKAYERDDK